MRWINIINLKYIIKILISEYKSVFAIKWVNVKDNMYANNSLFIKQNKKNMDKDDIETFSGHISNKCFFWNIKCKWSKFYTNT